MPAQAVREELLCVARWQNNARPGVGSNRPPATSVSDIFLPKWFADRIFPICGGFFLVGCLLIAIRVLSQ